MYVRLRAVPPPKKKKSDLTLLKKNPAFVSSSCVQGLRHGSRWIHLERGAVSRAQDDGGQQSEGRFRCPSSTLFTRREPLRERSVDTLQDSQLQEIVDKTIMEADKDGDGKLSFEEFTQMVANTVRGLTLRNLCGPFLVTDCPSLGYREADDTGGPLLALWLLS